MKLRWIASFVFVFLLLGSDGPAQAQLVTPEQAEQVATNWITMVISMTGGWGNSSSAQVTEVIEFKRGDRLLGYFCPVSPTGCIVVSLVEGLAPVKQFSETDIFDPTLDEGPADLLKLQMERLLDDIEAKLGPLAQIQPTALDTILELNHRSSWQELDVNPALYRVPLLKPTDNYQQSQVLLTSHWKQTVPYNLQCPDALPGCLDLHCTVGCVATAGAQIMRYWSWPPGYAWWDMPDTLNSTDPIAQIDATAYFCRWIGDAVGMSYCSEGCASSADTEDMEAVYESIAYSTSCAKVNRSDYDWVGWYNLIMAECNQNRPMHYRILKHSIVCDGYWNLPTPLYHMNYGWANSYNMWYTIDALYYPAGGSVADEYMLVAIRPNVSIGPMRVGSQPGPTFYVDQDCFGYSASFLPGADFQFLPRTELTCASGYLRLDGTPGYQSWLFTVVPNRGVRIDYGTIKLLPGGSIKFAEFKRP